MIDRQLKIEISKMLRKNSLILFNLKGQENTIVNNRHICSKISEIYGSNTNEKIFNSFILSIALWQNWTIHAKKSLYSLNWFSCVQVEDEWIKKGLGMPPEVIFNSEKPFQVKEFFREEIRIEETLNIFKRGFQYFEKDFLILKKDIDNKILYRIVEKSM